MPSISGTSDTSSQLQTQQANQSAALEDQKKADSASANAQLALQDAQAQQAMGQSSAAMYEQMRAQALQMQQQQASAPPLTPDQQKVADAVAGMVMAQLTGNQTQQQSAESMNQQGQQSGGQESNEGLRMGSIGANMSDFQGEAEKRIQDAAKVSVYKKVTDLMAEMNNKLKTKQALGEAVSTYNQLLANKWEGKKNMPVYELDQNTGQVKMVGKKAMTYDEAVAERDKLREQKDSINEESQTDMIKMQSAIDEMSRLESLLSNCMKAYGDTQNTLAQALKA